MARLSHEAIDRAVRKSIQDDPELAGFLAPYFSDKSEASQFVNRCLRKLTTRRMMLRVQWYTKVADDVDTVRRGRVPLQLIFLIAMAEGVAKQRLGKQSVESEKAVMEFFRHISSDDRGHLDTSFQRSLGSSFHRLTFKSKIRILWDVRNRAVHGENFWNFFLMGEDDKAKYRREKYTDYGVITTGLLGKRGRKRSVFLDLTLTYGELRDIFVRTAIANIQALLD